MGADQRPGAAVRFRARTYRAFLLKRLADGPDTLGRANDAFFQEYRVRPPSQLATQSAQLLERDGKIERIQKGVYRLSGPRDVLQEVQTLWPPTWRLIEFMLGRHEKLTERQALIARLPLGAPPSSLSVHLRRLKDLGLIRSEVRAGVRGYVPSRLAVHFAGLDRPQPQPVPNPFSED